MTKGLISSGDKLKQLQQASEKRLIPVVEPEKEVGFYKIRGVTAITVYRLSTGFEKR
jgi:hypothetical protein